MSLDQLVDEALRLPEDARAALASTLLESLDAAEECDPSVWDSEIRRRIDELDGGTVKAVPWGEARRRIAGQDDGAPG